jgi:hypothetical protein
VALTPFIRIENGTFWLYWEQDPRAIAYDVEVSWQAAHIQAGKGASSMKLGKPQQPFTVKIAPAYAQTYESITYPEPPAPALTVVQNLTSGQIISAPVAWTAVPSDTVTKVEFFVDGLLKWTENSAPYRFNGDAGWLDPAAFADGNHDFKVVATASSGSPATATVTASTKKPVTPTPTGFDAFKGLCFYADGDFVKGRDLAGIRHARCDWPSAARVTAAKNAGIQMLPIACYSHGYASISHAPPTNMTGWLDALKRDYAGAWQSPPAVEIWNEPWHKEFWQPTPNPAGYMNLVQQAAQALWSVNPRCIIVVSADNNGHTNTSGTTLWRKNVIAADTTGLLKDPRVRPSTHNYCEGRTPTTVTSNPCAWDLDRWKCAYADYKTHGHPNPQVWVTEWGWEVNEGTHYFGTVTEAQQRDYIVQGIRMMQQSGIVERAFCFYLQTSNVWSYNWLDLSNQPRDVCAAVKAL